MRRAATGEDGPAAFRHGILLRCCWGTALLLTAMSASAGTLTNVSFTPASNITGVSTTYTVSFTLASTVNNTRAFRILQQVSTPAAGNTNFDNATLVSLTGGTLNNTNVAIALAVPGEVYFNINAGSAAAGTVVTMVLGGIVNPLSTSGNSYRMRVDNLSDAEVDFGIAPGNVYVPNPGPSATSPIPDQNNIEKQNGTYTAVANLNAHFADGDGDALTFSVQDVGNAAVATAAVAGSALTITPQGFGSTTITVRASDNAEGTADDTFNINVIGLLGSASVTPASVFVGATTSYSIVFRPETAIVPGDFLTFSHAAGGPNQNASTLGSLSGTLTGTRTSGGAQFTVIQITGGSADATQLVTMVLNGVVNPAVSGTGPQYLIEKTNGSTVQDQARVNGTVFGTPPTGIFQNGFETGMLISAKELLQLLPPPRDPGASTMVVDAAGRSIRYRDLTLTLDADHVDAAWLLESLRWAVSATEPQGDRDGDGIANLRDEDPFGLRTN